MSKNYSVELQRCDICHDQSACWNLINQEFPDHQANRNNQEYKARFGARWRELMNANRKICFYFLADCGGDSIAMCSTRMTNILSEVKAAETFNEP